MQLDLIPSPQIGKLFRANARCKGFSKRTTAPAMEAGIADHVWEIEELVALLGWCSTIFKTQMNKKLIILAVLFWACIFCLWAGNFAVIPRHRYDPANVAFFAVFAALAALFGLLFVRRAFRDVFRK